MSNTADRTHVEDVKDPIEILPPGHDHIFVVLRVEQSRNWISFTLLDDPALDVGHSSNIEA